MDPSNIFLYRVSLSCKSFFVPLSLSLSLSNSSPKTTTFSNFLKTNLPCDLLVVSFTYLSDEVAEKRWQVRKTNRDEYWYLCDTNLKEEGKMRPAQEQKNHQWVATQVEMSK